MHRHHRTARQRAAAVCAAALALGVTILAAPAAHAAGPIIPDGFRPAPLADAMWVDGAGDLRAAASATITTYADAGSSTGALPAITPGPYESVGDIQVVVPVGWGAGDQLVLTVLPNVGLPGDVTFERTPDVSITPMPISEADLARVVGVASSVKATVASPAVLASGSFTAIDAAQTPIASVPTANKERLFLTFPTADPNGGLDYAPASGNGYLVTLSNVKIGVSASAPIVRGGGSIYLLNGAKGATIAYITRLKLAAAAASAERTFAGDVTLPALTVSELRPNVFTASRLPFRFTVWNKDAGTPLAVDTTKLISMTDSRGSVMPPATALSATDARITGLGVMTNDAAALDSMTLSGLSVKNAPRVGLEVRLQSSYYPAAVNTAAFAKAPDLAVPTVTFSTTAALPRIAGDNRYHTAQLASARFGSGLNTVIVANGENSKMGIDALAANYVAGAYGAPILLTAAKWLPPETMAGLTAATDGASGAITVYVMGKTDSISAPIRSAIVATLNAAEHMTVHVVEIAGSNRYATSAQVANLPGAPVVGAVRLGGTGPFLPTAFLASGTVNADALAAGAVAYANKLPILLTAPDALDASVSGAITSLGIKQVVILGGTDRVSAAVAGSLAALGVASVKRVDGVNRYDTAAKIAELDWSAFGTTGSTALVANGVTGWPDALSAGPLAGKHGYPLLTVSGTSLTPQAAAFLAAHKAAFTDGVVGLGTSATVSDGVLSAALAALN